MRSAKKWICRTGIMCGATLALVVGQGRAWSGQNPGTQYQNDDDVTRREIANFDQFLDSHPAIDKELASNPSLVNDANYLQSRPDLRDYFSAHPRVRAELQENPSYFMRRENRFEGSPADRDRAPGQNPNPDLNQREVGRMDQWLDEHPDVEHQLQRNPALINDSNFLAQHQDLQVFLNAHPGIHQEFAENPSYFMQRENQFEGTPADRDRMRANAGATAAAPANPAPANLPPANAAQPNPNPDLNQREVGRMDQFFDDHPKIEKELEKNPSLINNAKFLDHNKDLGAFLTDHPQIREEFTENPSYFMRRENQFEGTAADRDRARTNPNRPTTAAPNAAPANPNPDLNARQVAQTDQFLDDHPDIEKQLEKNPSLIDDDKYVDHHKDLAQFLAQHPGIRHEFAENPSYFMRRQNQFEGTAADRDTANSSDRDRNLNDKDLSDMHKLLEKHKDVAKDLDKDPSRANDDKYLAHHKDLRKFFDEHEHARTECAQNPRQFMDREREFDHRLENRRMDQNKNSNLDKRADTDHRNQL